MQKRVIMLGGYGTYGRLITEQLMSGDAAVVVAGRDGVKGEAFARSAGAEFVRCDVNDAGLLAKTISHAFLVINASGPFQAEDYTIPQTCIAQGCHYIDLGDGRDYVAGISRLHESAITRGVFVCVGASTTPAVTSAVAAELRAGSEHVRSIRMALSAGNKNQAGVSTIASILAYVGATVRIWQDRRWQEAIGWGLGEFVTFPDPVGRRRVQLCNVPDLELFPALFDADSVVFKAGVELTPFNYALGGLASLRRVWPSLNLAAFAALLVRLSGLFKGLGTLNGSLGVWLTAEDGQERSLALVAPGNGPRIPSAPAVLLARKLLSEGVPAPGAYPCVGFLTLQEFIAYLEPFGIFLVRGENGVWKQEPPLT